MTTSLELQQAEAIKKLTAALLGGAALYTTPAQRALLSLFASRPQAAQAISQALQNASPRLALPAAQVGLQLTQ